MGMLKLRTARVATEAERADAEADLAGVAPGDALELLAGKQFRVDTNAALGPAVRQVDRGVLDRHPAGQRHHFLQRDVLVVAHAALAGTAREAVLDAESLVVGDRPVVQLDRDVDHEAALGPAQGLDVACQSAEVGDDCIDLREEGRPGTVVAGIDEREIRHE